MGKQNKKTQKAVETWQEKLLQNKKNIISNSSESSDVNIKVQTKQERQNGQIEENKKNEINPKPEYLVEVYTDGYHINQVSPIRDKETREAFAPYNFIPLNTSIVFSEFDIDSKEWQFNKYHPNLKTGYISVNIETKVPLYVRDSYTESQLRVINTFDEKIEKARKDRNKELLEALKIQKAQKLWEYSDFFSPASDKLRIPGSTCRGLIKNIVEIAAFGKFLNYEDKRLYFRGLADRSNLQEEYTSYGLNAYRSYQMSCGILKKEGVDYHLFETGTPGQINCNDALSEITGTGIINFDSRKMKAYPVTSKNYYIVVTGDIRGKSHHWTVNFRNAKSNTIIVDKRDIKDYEGDENRSEKAIDLLEAADTPNGTPCFYTKWDEIENDQTKVRIFFGHTGMFRVPYTKTIGEHIPNELKNENNPDITEAIFGNENTFAGRVFFEDAICTESDKTKVLLGANHPQILSTPKPTTFQHYLTQPYEDIKKLKHYNPDFDEKLSVIRGYKQYWHKTLDDWIENNQDIIDRHKNQYTKINPVKTRTTFTGRIRFENLSRIELGALLFALDLPEECCHKIGMGKPLGLGSIRITPTLHLSYRNNRYKNIAAEWASELPKTEDVGNTISDFKNDFSSHILDTIKSDKKTLWEEDRMNELKTMLNFEKIPDKEKTKYMSMQNKDFRNRPILPKPSDVIKEE